MRLPQIECNVLLDEFPTIMETRKAVQQLSSGKAPGVAAINAEVYAFGVCVCVHCMWRKEAIPQEYKDAPVIHLYKRKGNPQVFENQRGSIAGKILAKILLFRLNVHFVQKGPIPASQCGFRKDRGTIDMIFTTRKLQEKSQEQNVDLYTTFVDLTKAFDIVIFNSSQIKYNSLILWKQRNRSKGGSMGQKSGKSLPTLAVHPDS